MPDQPPCFNLVITCIEKKMVNEHGGVNVDPVHVNGLCYTDDIVLFSVVNENKLI